MRFIKKNCWHIAAILYLLYVYTILPKYFYGDSLFFLELFEENNWNLYAILIDWYNIYGYYRIIGIIILYLFYFISFGNIYLLLLFQLILFLMILKKLSKQIWKNKKIFSISIFCISCVPFSNIILLQPISFHQLTSTYILISVLKDYFTSESIKSGLINISSPWAIILLTISTLIYEITFPLLLLTIFISLIYRNKNIQKFIIILFSIIVIALITENDKTVNMSTFTQHLSESFFYQIIRYFYYGVYFFKYCISNLLINYSNIFNIGLVILFSLMVIKNKNILKIKNNNNKKPLFIFCVLISVWLFYPFSYQYIHIPTLNTIFTYSLFFIIPILLLYNKLILNYYYKVVLIILFFINQALLVTHCNEIEKNFNDSKEIISYLDNNNYNYIILQDYENKKYFRRYSNKFSTLNHMININKPGKVFWNKGHNAEPINDGTEKTTNLLSSKINQPLDENDIVISMKDNKIEINKELSVSKPENYDYNSITILNAYFGFDYYLNKMHYSK